MSVTSRPNCENVLRLLANLGGDINVPDSYVNSYGFNEIIKELPSCSLAFNCVGGEGATDIARVLSPGATLVTYGGMSKRPMTIPYDILTSKQLTLRGFWMAKWHAERSEVEKSEMISDIARMIRDQQLSFFYEMHDFDDFEYALKKATEPFRLRKVLLNMDYPDRMKEHDALNPEDYFKFEAPVV